MKFLKIPMLALIVFAAVIPNNATSRSPGNTQSGGSELVPELDLIKAGGGRFHLKDLRGKVVVLNFWATWCVPCRVEIPELNKLSDELHGQGLTIVGVSWDDSEKQIAAFRSQTKVNYPVVFGGQLIESKFGGIPNLPTSFIIDRGGRIRQKIIGVTERSEIETTIKSLLAE